jgi:DNA-directed RNA polymerase subunit F
MTDNQKRILEMLAEKKITIDEAYRLLTLVESEGNQEGSKRSIKYLRVMVEPNKEGGTEAGAERVNVRVPLALIRAGMKLTSLIPPGVANQVNDTLREKGIELDFRNIKAEDIEQLVEALSDLEVDVESGREKVHVYVE